MTSVVSGDDDGLGQITSGDFNTRTGNNTAGGILDRPGYSVRAGAGRKERANDHEKNRTSYSNGAPKGKCSAR